MIERLSSSQITTYLMCPRKYRYRYIDKLEPESRSANMAFGSAVHAAIAWWWQKRIDGRSPTDEDALRVFRADWLSQVETGDLDYGKKEPQEFTAMGESLLQLFMDRFRDELPASVEGFFEVELVDPRSGEVLPVPLIGYTDFVAPGLLGEIKTTARRVDPKKQWSLQLGAYAYAMKAASGELPRIQVVELIKTKVPKLEVFDLEMTEADVSWFLEVAAEVFGSIERGAFFPSPGWACGGCEFKGACRPIS